MKGQGQLNPMRPRRDEHVAPGRCSSFHSRLAHRLGLIVGLLLVLRLGAAHAAAAPDEAPITVPVIVDGNTLFRVRGVEAYPADQRARQIGQALLAVARNRQFHPDSLQVRDSELGTGIYAGNVRIMAVIDADARMEQVSRTELAFVYASRMSRAIRDYRTDRAPRALTSYFVLTGLATALLIVLLLIIRMLWRRTCSALEARFRRGVKDVGIGSFEIVRADRLLGMLRSAIDGVRVAIVLVAAVFYIHFVLGLFPPTRAASNQILGYVSEPLEQMAQGIYQAIPGLTFIIILFLIVRYVLKLVDLFFAAVGRGEVSISGFDLDWASMTARLVKLGIIALSLVVAYPYIPGSSSDAFKGVSVFGGILFSLGASSTIANTIAGYMLIYRRVFKVGDRVKIGDVVGTVVHVRAQVTHLQTPKNEEVIIPNSTILTNQVTNYSSMGRTVGLILHTTVGIGYETPWRQVQAMLLTAAKRTEGLMPEPPAFVLLRQLDTFSVTYELNAYCGDAMQMFPLYSAMHRNVLDVFNEHGVQIMTPAYEGDPETVKIVPPEKWHLPPAGAPAETK